MWNIVKHIDKDKYKWYSYIFMLKYVNLYNKLMFNKILHNSLARLVLN